MAQNVSDRQFPKLKEVPSSDRIELSKTLEINLRSLDKRFRTILFYIQEEFEKYNGNDHSVIAQKSVELLKIPPKMSQTESFTS